MYIIVGLLLGLAFVALFAGIYTIFNSAEDEIFDSSFLKAVAFFIIAGIIVFLAVIVNYCETHFI